ncbi:MAG: 6-hydroxymethylpterin diphosphokinase MptE-like protein [Methanomassiliicoccales archaeon]|jgi:hypothetical protein
MDFEDWEPYYLEVLRDFGFSRKEDEASAQLLESKVPKDRILNSNALSGMFNRSVTVFGNGPLLENEISKREYQGTLISAGCATSVLLRNGVTPDIMVTDLDGPIEADIQNNLGGAVAVIHAHGDNMHLINRYANEFRGKVVLSTQSKPFGSLINTGGFTDGDRAVMLARTFGVKSITLIGFDFENPVARTEDKKNVKKRKLAWAKKLIFELNLKDVEIVMK